MWDIEVTQGTRRAQVRVPVERFPAMNWPAEAMGARAILAPGSNIKDHVRAAVQVFSHDDVVERTRYAHTGWRKIDDEWVYLHAGGAVGAEGPVTGIETILPPALQLYVLPDPPSGAERASAIRASLRMLEVAPRSITTPILAGIFRAVLGDTDFSIHASGATGVFKTELAALAQQSYGPGLNARHLPGSFSSTANALEGLAFTAKDTLLVIDDFAPTGSMTDVQRMHKDADRLFRGQGNRSGRLRMRADATLKAAKYPRGLIFTTGEDIPRGQSLRARLLILELASGHSDVKKLTACQQDAANGLYAMTMAAYLSWLARQYEDIKGQLTHETSNLRALALKEGHKRTPGIVASLAAGLRYFLQFAVDAGTISIAEQDELWGASWAALLDAAKDQSQYQVASEPAQRFIQLIIAAIASGNAHVTTRKGEAPHQQDAWRWRKKWIGTGDFEQQVLEPKGTRIGWIDEQDLYLEPESTFAVAQRLTQSQGDTLSVTLRTLHKRLWEKGLLASRDTTRRTLTVRKVAEGKTVEVLHFQARLFLDSSAPDQKPTEKQQDGEK